MRNIFAITGNLLAEYTHTFDMPKLGQTVRAKDEPSFQTGGKGVNVVKAIYALSKASAKYAMNPHAVIFPAGHTGEMCLNYIKKLSFKNIISQELEGETRMGLVCIDSKSKAQTTFLGADIPLEIDAFKLAIKKISKKAKASDILALCGSFPSWTKSFAQEIENLVKTKKLLLCADTYGAPLSDILKMNCALIKINRAEFFSSVAKIRDKGGFDFFKKHFEEIAKKISTTYFAVSDGESASLFIEKGDDVFAIPPPRVKKEISATGCGDIMFASLICGLFAAKNDFKTSAKNATKWASAETQYRQICALPKSKLQKIFTK